MKNKNRIVALSVSVCILISMIIPLALPMVSFADEETIYINNADEFIEIERYTLEEALEMISQGEIKDGKTIAALYAWAARNK